MNNRFYNTQTPSEYRNKNILRFEDFRNKKSSSSVWDWREEAKEEIDNVESDDDVATNFFAKENAKLFVKNLPWNITAPSVSLEPDGAILLEWYKKIGEETHVFSAIIDLDKIIYSTFGIGEPDQFGEVGYRGVTNCSTLSIKMLSKILENYFGLNVTQTQKLRHPF